MSVSENADSQEEDESRSFNKKDFKLLLTMLLFFLVSSCLYLLDAEEAETERVELVVQKPENMTESSTVQALAPAETPTSEQSTASKYGTVSSHGGGGFDKGCSDICTKREASRKEKFGGDLLDFRDIVKLAEAGHEKVISTLRHDYGEYFDRMFINKGNGTHYFGMRPADLQGPSKERMKRKMKIKVLKMMASVRTSESNLHGCDCVEKAGSVNSRVDEGISTDIPDFYEKYVFANGGHSNAAGHGNKYSESYTAVFGRDVRPVWEAIGIEMIDRNHAMGGLASNPYHSTCVKEVFGTDVDFLAWNYGMTDSKPYSAAHFIYRGALIPSRPAFVFVDWVKGANLGRSFVEFGLAMFRSRLDGNPVSQLPDMTPDEIPISNEQAQKIPDMARNLKCNKRLEGKDLCFGSKWSCTEKMQAAGIDCICPHIGKRNSWHMGYRAHALQGHLLALPFIEMLLEALRELAATPTTDSEALLADLQKEEDADFRLFMESPLLDLLSTAYETLGEKTDPLYETWFRGHSICRTSYLPCQSRFLGIMTESGKTGDIAMYTHETYDTGDVHAKGIARDVNGFFPLVDDTEPPAGKFLLLANDAERSGFGDVKKHEAECPAIVMPDYIDKFWAPLLDGKASITVPNKKEKEHYGYDPKLFKGVIAFILPLWSFKCKGCQHSYDLNTDDFLERNVTMVVNSKPVKSVRVVSGKVVILQGDNDNPFWEPDLETEDYTIEFQVAPGATQYNLLLTHFILM
ncbi:unnamed protein product [Cylindrotheca closterium]|uniref:Uncharacterized protein n=1 Tax=Cylindrotheca closterium TaxID=2856 RepID=A0AAD2CED6_9STRA|nr:unnamed protein product [Cylindrotheca closterium]